MCSERILLFMNLILRLKQDRREFVANFAFSLSPFKQFTFASRYYNELAIIENQQPNFHFLYIFLKLFVFPLHIIALRPNATVHGKIKSKSLLRIYQYSLCIYEILQQLTLLSSFAKKKNDASVCFLSNQHRLFFAQ